MKEKRDFTTEISHREMVSFLLPILFVKFFEQAAGMANTAVMSRLLSPEVMVCVSACRIYPTMQNNLIGATATGFGIYVTRYIGRHDSDRLQKAVREALTGAAVLALAGGGLLFLLEPLMDLVNIPADIRGQAHGYLFWLFAGSGALVFQNLFLSMLYGLGESAFAGGAAAVGVVLQPFLTSFFVRGMGLEVKAVPVALMTNRLILTAIMLVYLLWKYRQLFSGKRMEMGTGKVWKALWGCGFSRAVMLTIVWCGSFMIQREVNQMPDTYISAYMYAVLAEDFFLVPIYACEQAAAYILAQNVGAGKASLVRRYYWRLNRLSWLFCGALVGIIWLWAPAFVRLVTGAAAAEEVVACASRWLKICVFAFPALSVDQIGRMNLQAVGAYRNMWILGILEGVLRAFLAVFVISGSGFDALIGSFFCVFLWNGTAIGISCLLALKRLKEGVPDET